MPFRINVVIESQSPSCDGEAGDLGDEEHDAGIRAGARTLGFKTELVYHTTLTGTAVIEVSLRRIFPLDLVK